MDGDGFERQEQAARTYCIAHGLAVCSVFKEKGVSGTVEGMDRPEFVSAVQWLRDNGGGGIVVERLDRLARDLMVQEVLLAECRKVGIPVFSSDQPAALDLASNDGDPTRKLIRQIMGALAEWEKSMLVKKLAVARARIRARDGKCEGPRCYGELPGEAPVRAALMELLARHSGASWGHVALRVQEAGFRTRKGTPWDKSSLCRLWKQRPLDFSGERGTVVV